MTEKAEIVGPDAVLAYWFDELEEKDWWQKSEDVDREIARRFGPTHLALAGSIPQEWWASADSVLALIIVFDQFPRNMYRGTPLAFATDCLALREACAAVDAGLDKLVSEDRRFFFYMPFEHSEDLADQDRCIELMAALGNERLDDFAQKHRDVVAAYGRFPHRNAILARESTAEEKDYLSKPGSGF